MRKSPYLLGVLEDFYQTPGTYLTSAPYATEVDEAITGNAPAFTYARYMNHYFSAGDSIGGQNPTVQVVGLRSVLRGVSTVAENINGRSPEVLSVALGGVLKTYANDIDCIQGTPPTVITVMLGAQLVTADTAVESVTGLNPTIKGVTLG